MAHSELRKAHEIVLEGSFNFRDLGGYQTENGRTVKKGLFFRSDDLSQLTQNDIEKLQAMGMRTIVDYRNEQERKRRPNQPILHTKTFLYTPKAEIAVVASSEAINDEAKVAKLNELAQTEEGRAILVQRQHDMSDQMKDLVRLPSSLDVYRKLVALIKDASNLPLLQHCHGGKDRTGWGSAIILLLLDVRMDEIYADYLLTGEMNAARNKRRMADYQQYTSDPFVLDYLYSLMDTRKHYLDSAFEEITRSYGSIAAYLTQGLQVTPAEREQLQAAYLDS